MKTDEESKQKTNCGKTTCESPSFYASLSDGGKCDGCYLLLSSQQNFPSRNTAAGRCEG